MSGNPFAERSQENLVGALRREATIVVRAARDADGDTGPMVAAPTTIEIALSSEAPVERFDWMSGERYFEVLDHSARGVDLSYAADGLPFCVDHDLDDQIGIVEELRVDSDRVLRGTVRRGNHPNAAWLFADMAAGIRKKVSIGYWPGDVYTQTKDKNGVVTRRYTGWTLYECSSVTVPADYAVGVGRSASGVARTTEAAPTADSNEVQMDQLTTSERGAAPAPDTRPQELAALARNFPAHSRLAEWIGENVSVDAARNEVMRKLAEAAEQRAPIAPAAPVDVQVGKDRAEDKPWGSFSDFMRSVKRAADGLIDPRLNAQRGVATGLGIGQDSDGGFLVPEQYATGVVTRAFEGGKLLSRVKHIPVSGNQYHMNLVDESSRATGSRWGGIRAFRIGENDSPTASKPKFRRATLDVTKKLAVLAYVTEEQLEDATATDAILETAMTEEVTFATEREIWEGAGGGECLGIFNSSALVTVAAEGGQTAGTINTQNVVKMNARLWSRSNPNAVWFIQQQALEQLPLMTLANQPVYLPPSGLSGAGFGTLFGKPIEVVEYASALGTVGDVALLDLTQYALGDKARNTIARSMHVRFVQGEEAFRLIYRVDGTPMWNTPLTPFKGSNTVSPFITLAAR